MIPLRLVGFAIFAAFLLVLPLPLFGLEGSFVPTARYWQLGAVCVGVIAAEGAGGMVGLFAALLLGHAVVYTTVIAIGTRLLVRFALRPLPPRLRDHVVVLGVTLACAVASYADFYDSQFHHSAAHASLLELYR